MEKMTHELTPALTPEATEPRKDDTIGTTVREAPATKPNPAPSPIERHEAARAARERLLTAKNEAFPRSTQYRPAGDGMANVGSGEV